MKLGNENTVTACNAAASETPLTDIAEADYKMWVSQMNTLPASEEKFQISLDQPDDGWETARKIENELNTFKAGYAALHQLVERQQVFGDIDINWEEFPKTTLCMAHEENIKLKSKLKAADELEKSMVEIKQFAISKAGNRLMQVAQPFRELVNKIKYALEKWEKVRHE